jgi:hypothetical protein
MKIEDEIRETLRERAGRVDIDPQHAWDRLASRREQPSGRDRVVTIAVAFAVFAAAAIFAWRSFNRTEPIAPVPATPAGASLELSLAESPGWQARSGYPAGAIGPVLEVANFDLWSRGDGLTTDFYGAASQTLEADSVAIRVQELVGVCGCTGLTQSSLPLALDRSDLKDWGEGAFATTVERVGQTDLVLDVEFGSKPSDQMITQVNDVLARIAIGPEAMEQEPGGEPTAPSFAAAPGWSTAATSMRGENTPIAWTSNQPLIAEDLSTVGRNNTLPFIPRATLQQMPADGVVIEADTMPADPSVTNSPNFPKRQLPLDLSTAAISSRWEGQVSLNVPLYAIRAQVGDAYLTVRVFFGTQQPSGSVLSAAQEQLSRLQLGQVDQIGDTGGTTPAQPSGYPVTVPDLAVGTAAAGSSSTLRLGYQGTLATIENGGTVSYTVPTGTRLIFDGTAETIAWGWGSGSDPYDKPVPITRGIPVVIMGKDGEHLQLRLRAEWTDGQVGEWTIRFTVTVPSKDEIVLACPESDHVRFEGPKMVLLPGSDLFIRANLPGVRSTDAVVQVTWPQGDSWDGTWAIYRDGALVALVEYGNLSGTECEDVGIG